MHKTMTKTKTKTLVAVALVTLAVIGTVAGLITIQRKSGSRSGSSIIGSGGSGSRSGSPTADPKDPSSPSIAPIPVAAAICGNGKLETGEECDDDNKVSGDGCSSVCKKESASGVRGVEKMVYGQTLRGWIPEKPIEYVTFTLAEDSASLNMSADAIPTDMGGVRSILKKGSVFVEGEAEAIFDCAKAGAANCPAGRWNGESLVSTGPVYWFTLEKGEIGPYDAGNIAIDPNQPERLKGNTLVSKFEKPLESDTAFYVAVKNKLFSDGVGVRYAFHGGTPKHFCGNGSCEASEDGLNCSSDCQAEPEETLVATCGADGKLFGAEARIKKYEQGYNAGTRQAVSVISQRAYIRDNNGNTLCEENVGSGGRPTCSAADFRVSHNLSTGTYLNGGPSSFQPSNDWWIEAAGRGSDLFPDCSSGKVGF